ncbi:hypothetical protein [Streptomyces sp. NPDC059092]|uniref:hypothetical protein n=1 Tax=Streptomyces sp. NPDC059092 TaxID=3346725 RepID=UPI0036879360
MTTTDDDGNHRNHGAPPLPEAVRAVPYSWATGFGRPPDTPESAGNLALARAVLEACLPAAPFAVPEPPPEVRAKDLGAGEALPDWIEARSVPRALMPYARDVTRERMAEAEARCGRAWTPRTSRTSRRGGPAVSPPGSRRRRCAGAA